MQKILIPLTVAGLLLLSACTAHKIAIQQGNIVTQEQLALLKPGLDKRQVTFILGTPLIQDPLHAQRWDYYYSFKPGGQDVQQRYRLTLYFEGDRLAHFDTSGAVPEKPPLTPFNGQAPAKERRP